MLQRMVALDHQAVLVLPETRVLLVTPDLVLEPAATAHLVLLTGPTKQVRLEPLEMLVQQVMPERVRVLVGLAEPHPTHGQVLPEQQVLLETLVLREAQELAQLQAILAELLRPIGLVEPEPLVMPEPLVLQVPLELGLAQAEVAELLLLTGQVNLVLLAMRVELQPAHRS